MNFHKYILSVILLLLPVLVFAQNKKFGVRAKVWAKGYVNDLRPTNWDYAAFGLGILDGVCRGTLEALHADNAVLERKFKMKSPYAFGASREWERGYVTNRYRDGEGNINPHKPEYFGNFGRTAHHTLGDISKVSSRVGYGLFMVGAYIDIHGFKKKPLSVISKGIIIWGVSSLTEKTVYGYLRR